MSSTSSLHAVRAHGRGRVEVPAYGLADAEHQVEKELLRAWPGARVEVLEITRAGEARIVEEFTVAYRVEATVQVEAPTPEEAWREALRRLREALGGTRFRRIEWTRVEL